jgi:hypothetical protein
MTAMRRVFLPRDTMHSVDRRPYRGFPLDRCEDRIVQRSVSLCGLC